MRLALASSDKPTTVFGILDNEPVVGLARPAMRQKRGRFEDAEDHGRQMEPPTVAAHCCSPPTVATPLPCCSPPTAAARCWSPPTAAARLPSPAAPRYQRTPVRRLNCRQDPLLIRRPPDLHVVVAPPSLQGWFMPLIHEYDSMLCSTPLHTFSGVLLLL